MHNLLVVFHWIVHSISSINIGIYSLLIAKTKEANSFRKQTSLMF